ncbi:unnamed protein product [Paramecium octaurelia]|uniref:Uncharacterized protein n=1 Tax=Paramecium octaurelia TaxID=43137 RepID=A0A8S1UZP4_PAROT|nr:unnamed protein product [Paramecium octaurelia]
MYKPQMIEKEKDFICSMTHQHQLVQLFQVINLIQIKDSYAINILSTLSHMKRQQDLKNSSKQLKIIRKNNQNAWKIVSHQLQQKLNQLIGNAKDWITNLQSIVQKYSEYSLHKELDIMIMSQNTGENNQINQVNQIKQLNDSLYKKINNKLDSLKQFEEQQNCQQILKELSSQLEQNFNLNINENQENTNQALIRLNSN